MKKTYMIPSNKVVELGSEECVLIVESQQDGLTMTLSEDVAETEDYVKEEKLGLWDKLW